MNQLLYFVAQPIDWYDVLSKSDESIFLSLQSIFLWRKLYLISLFCFVFLFTNSFSLDTFGETASWITSLLSGL